jgi:RNA methyltransferase, TrmH family
VYVDGEAELNLSNEALLARAHAHGSRIFPLAPGVMARIADTVTPQPLLGVVRMPDTWSPGSPIVGPGATFVVVCAQVRDPGNAGTVIRSADAAGADAVVFCEQSVDPYNPKAVRAAAGSVLHLPVVEAGAAGDVLEELGAAGLRRLGAVAHGGTPHIEADLLDRCALVFGNEASGLGGTPSSGLDEEISISMAGRAESLNVAMAASVLCFEVLRQRSPSAL